jgi:hypothetical protein
MRSIDSLLVPATRSRNGWTSPQILCRYSARARRGYDRIMGDTSLPDPAGAVVPEIPAPPVRGRSRRRQWADTCVQLMTVRGAERYGISESSVKRLTSGAATCLASPACPAGATELPGHAPGWVAAGRALQGGPVPTKVHGQEGVVGL